MAEFQPGAAKHGNFINYYSFNPPERRIDLIPAASLINLKRDGDTKPRIILDVGCNAGDLTTALYEHIQTETEKDSHFQILGVDLDPQLITRAQDSNKYPANIQFKTLDIMDKDMRESVLKEYLCGLGASSFHLVTCFSITMWVHLHNGDTGLKDFLSYLSGNCTHFLLEPQPWKCYRNAMRRMHKLGEAEFPLFKTLTWTERVDDDIADYLQSQCNMTLVQTFGKTEWSRKLLLFQHTETTN